MTLAKFKEVGLAPNATEADESFEEVVALPFRLVTPVQPD
jgi:hypothetical protein